MQVAAAVVDLLEPTQLAVLAVAEMELVEPTLRLDLPELQTVAAVAAEVLLVVATVAQAALASSL
jgi:hypothetical protein